MAVRRPWTIRSIERDDAPAILAVVRSLSKWFTSQAHQDAARELSTHGGFVAVRGRSVLGFILWTPTSDATVAELSWIGVAEDEPHSGIGTSLLPALATVLRSRGFLHLEVDTVANNVDYEPYAETRRFYRARGFVDHRVDPKFYREGDEKYDRLVLGLDLT